MQVRLRHDAGSRHVVKLLALIWRKLNGVPAARAQGPSSRGGKHAARTNSDLGSLSSKLLHPAPGQCKVLCAANAAGLVGHAVRGPRPRIRTQAGSTGSRLVKWKRPLQEGRTACRLLGTAVLEMSQCLVPWRAAPSVLLAVSSSGAHKCWLVHPLGVFSLIGFKMCLTFIATAAAAAGRPLGRGG